MSIQAQGADGIGSFTGLLAEVEAKKRDLASHYLAVAAVLHDPTAASAA
ncbi:hypothetical protein [Methylobacterium sp. R2-1]|nr:hypothetical protein [Methylobacterium sp. R2-1]MBB2964702.1 hypothetical protein [Methylobacterium sp. R2-1]